MKCGTSWNIKLAGALTDILFASYGIKKQGWSTVDLAAFKVISDNFLSR